MASNVCLVTILGHTDNGLKSDAVGTAITKDAHETLSIHFTNDALGSAGTKCTPLTGEVVDPKLSAVLALTSFPGRRSGQYHR